MGKSLFGRYRNCPKCKGIMYKTGSDYRNGKKRNYNIKQCRECYLEELKQKLKGDKND